MVCPERQTVDAKHSRYGRESCNWIKKRRNEEYYKKSKQDHFRSRAAYKLIQLNDKYHFLNNAKIVIDVCCAPGSWIQAIQAVLGNTALVIGIDINKTTPVEGNVFLLQEDITNPDVSNKVNEHISEKADVIISDCSMKTSGTTSLDVERQNYLVTCTFENLVKKVLKAGGHFVAKVFQGPEINAIKKQFQRSFNFVKFSKPKSSLSSSKEMYLVCKGYLDE